MEMRVDGGLIERDRPTDNRKHTMNGPGRLAGWWGPRLASPLPPELRLVPPRPKAKGAKQLTAAAADKRLTLWRALKLKLIHAFIF